MSYSINKQQPCLTNYFKKEREREGEGRKEGQKEGKRREGKGEPGDGMHYSMQSLIRLVMCVEVVTRQVHPEGAGTEHPNGIHQGGKGPGVSDTSCYLAGLSKNQEWDSVCDWPFLFPLKQTEIRPPKSPTQ